MKETDQSSVELLSDTKTSNEEDNSLMVDDAETLNSTEEVFYLNIVIMYLELLFYPLN